MNTQHILIVDDDNTYRKMLSGIFSDYQITTSSDGKEALEELQDLTPDIIILDVMMPGMDGYEVCKNIRAMPHTASTPVIFYSSMESLEGRLRAYDLGANDYICKKSPHQEVRAKIVRLLNSEQEHVAIRQELNAGNSLLQNMQKETSALHVISQFSQACQFCFEYETVATVLFNCLFKLNLRGVVCFPTSKLIISSNGSHSQLEEEILLNSGSFGRIYSFGENRVILNWEGCALLVKDVGDNLDSLAHLMGALQTAVNSIDLKAKMLKKILVLDAKYKVLKHRLSDQASHSKDLKEQLFDSGLVSRCDIQDENDLDAILAPYTNDLTDIFVDADSHVAEITQLLKHLHAPPLDLTPLFEKKTTTMPPEACEDVLF